MTAPQGERAGFRGVTTQDPETQSKAPSRTVEWGPEHVDPNRTIVRVNGANPLTWSTGTGEGSRELRLELGFNSVPSAVLDSVVTGGLDSKGKPRRAVAKKYFEHRREIVTFDASGKPHRRMMPLAQIAQPSPGDEVHIIPAVKGSRSHYRTKARVKEQAQAAALVQQLQLQGQQMQEMLAQNAQLMAQNTELLAKVLGQGSEQPKTDQAPIDPSKMSVADLSDELQTLSQRELEQVMVAELRGKNRVTAIEAIRQAVDARAYEELEVDSE